MPTPKHGARYTYSANKGLGAAARVADPDVDDNLPADMAELDMPPGCPVTVEEQEFEHPDAPNVVVVWEDKQGTPRRTAIPADQFAALFERVK